MIRIQKEESCMRMHGRKASASRDVLRGRREISQELELNFSE